ncbi:MAG: hypothetical protein FD123_1757 [Bacteroidetes bacterium]|nr:MAG: hypothetical protein FD123_1757 [Bacteroidota bacterium]
MPTGLLKSCFFILALLITAKVSGQDTMAAADSLQAKASGRIKAQIKYHGHDSIVLDLANEKVYLYDSAWVSYEDKKMNAHYIVIDFVKNEVLAKGEKDSTGKILKAEFIDSDQTYYFDSIRYNIQTQKALIYDANTVDGDSHVIAEKAKKDSDNVVFIHKGLYTTCELDHPHFAIRAQKLKIIPDDKIITGPAYLEIGDVPTPLAVPFGFFPNKKGRASGLIIPTPGESPGLGFYLRDGGWYWGLSDKIDLAVRGDIYSKGSWGAKLQTNYRVRYKYNGNLNIKYARIIQGDQELPDSDISNDFFVTWNHVQDAKFNPTIRFSASVNGGTSTYNQLNSYNANDYLRNQFQSNVAWSKSWRFGSLSANLRHDQNTQTHLVNMTLPQLAFTVNRFFPFRNPNRIGSRFYDKIGVSMVTDFQNTLSVVDSTININETDALVKKMRNGIKTSIPVSSTLQFKKTKLKYFTLTPAANINTYTYFRTVNKTYDIPNDTILVDTSYTTRMAYDYNVNATISTRFYGMWTFRKGRVTALRHVMTPQVSFVWRPDFSAEKYGWYKDVQSNTAGGYQTYSIFEGGIYGSPGSGKSGGVNVNIGNSVEGKLRPLDTDTASTAKKFMLIDQFNLAFGYNILAEHFNWSNITFSGRTRLFKKLDINGSLSVDPYRINEDGVRIERFEWRENKRLGRITGAYAALSTSLRKGGLTASQPKTSGKGTEQEMNFINQHPEAFVDFNVPWSLNVGYTINYSKPSLTKTITQGIQLSGDVNLTPKWKVGFFSNYDLVLQKFANSSLNIYRDLHCWEMSFNWVPFGQFQNYNLTINVKSAVLQDLKLNRRRSWYDF